MRLGQGIVQYYLEIRPMGLYNLTPRLGQGICRWKILENIYCNPFLTQAMVTRRTTFVTVLRSETNGSWNCLISPRNELVNRF